MKKSGTMDALRERLVCRWMNHASEDDLNVAAGAVLPDAGSSDAGPQVATEATPQKTVAKTPPATQQTPESEPVHAMSSVAASSSATSSHAKVPEEKGQSVLNQCQPVSTPSKDVSGIFTDLNQGPQLEPDTANKTVDIVSEADVVLPVAAMVKILQGVNDNAENVAFLLAGQGFYKPMT